MRFTRKQFVILFTVTSLSTAVTADLLTVDAQGGADYLTIQEAVNAASNGDEILVMPGTYHATEGGPVVDMLGKSVWLHSADPDDKPIIDGSNWFQGIVCRSGETNTTIIEGFTIQNCSAQWNDWDGDGAPDSWEFAGGGMACSESHPTIINCTFTANFGQESGGGVFNYASNPTFTDCDFDWNAVSGSGNGGGMSNRMSSPTLYNCEFWNNSAVLGGGMYNYDGSSPQLQACLFSENDANYGGGIYNRFFSGSSLNVCTFYDNSALYGGGGMFSSSLSDVLSINCNFRFNSVTGAGGMGGASGNSNSSSTFTTCEFSGNSAVDKGGALYCTVGSQVNISDCTFDDNLANNGGVAYLDFFCDVSIEDSSFQSNTGTLSGGSLYVIDYCDVSMSNVLMTNNDSTDATVWSSNQNVLSVSDCTMEYNSMEIAGFDATDIQFSGSNSIAQIRLEGVNSQIRFASTATLDMLGGLEIHGGALQLDVDTLNAPAFLTEQGGGEYSGALGVTNNSGSLASASIGDEIALVDSPGLQGIIESFVFPAMPTGLGLRLSGGPGLVLEVIEEEGVQLDNPLLAGLDSRPVDLAVLDVNDDGTDELAVLYGGSPGIVAVFAISSDSPPTLIPSLTTAVGNDPADMDAGDIDNDGDEDLVIANGDDSTLSVLTSSEPRSGTSVFESKTVTVPGHDQKLSCVAIIDWNSNLNTVKDVVVGIDKNGEQENDTLQVLTDVSGSDGVGPSYEIPMYQYAGAEFSDIPKGVDAYRGSSTRTVEQGFIAGTRYGNIYKAVMSGARGTLINIGELNGRNVSSLEVTDLDDNGGDDKTDVLVGSDEGGMIYIIPGDDKRANGFGDIISIDVAVPVNDIYAADLDRDGDTDFVVTAPEASSYFVLRNGGASSFMPGGLGNRAWNKQDLPSSNTPDKVDGGDLDDKDEDDDWMSGSGSDSGLLGTPGTMEQTNIGSTESDTCSGDFNADGNINVNDLLILIAAWGPCEACAQDLNGDGAVNVNDLLVLIAAWGPCSP